MAVSDNLLPKVKANLILTHDTDDELLLSFISAALSYAESYQHVAAGWYETLCQLPNRRHYAVEPFLRKRDGSTARFRG